MQDIIDFRRKLIKVFDSPEGKDILKFFEEIYVNSTAMKETPEQTFYALGQKELMQGLIKDATTPLSEHS